MEIRVGVTAAGTFLLHGEPAPWSALEAALEAADPANDRVVYCREAANSELPARARDLIDLIIAQGLPVRLSTMQDYSDSLNLSGVASVAVPSGVTFAAPDGGIFLLPSPPPAEEWDRMVGSLPPVVPRGGGRTIAAIADTSFVSIEEPGVDAEQASDAIPFLGLLIGLAYAGNQVSVSNGNAPALESALMGAECLILDSGMLPHLPADWMQVAQRVLTGDRRVWICGREGGGLLPAIPSQNPQGWQYSEPEGEPSYVNCLLTTLAKAAPTAVEVATGRPLPELAALASDPDELEWIANLPFRYEELDPDAVIKAVSEFTSGPPGKLPTSWTATLHLALDDSELQPIDFSFELRADGVCKILRIEKIAVV